MRLRWVKLAEQSDKEGWPAARFLATLVEQEVADRSCRRMERHLAEARLPAGKTLATFDFEAVPMVSKAQVMALASGDAWLEKGTNMLLFGPPGGEPSLGCAWTCLGREWVARIVHATPSDAERMLPASGGSASPDGRRNGNSASSELSSR
jgi:hypothetical protein